MQAGLSRQCCLGGDLASANALHEAAAGLGHRPYLLASLALLAKQQIDDGLFEEERATLRMRSGRR